jgi:hypothetical protein
MAWCAGLFDGEGTVGTYTNKSGQTQIKLRIGQAHPEILERFKDNVGIGVVYGPYEYKDGRKPHWDYSVHKFETVQYVVASMFEFLGSVKQDQALTALRNYHIWHKTTL